MSTKRLFYKPCSEVKQTFYFRKIYVCFLEYEADVYIRQRWRDPRLENRNMASYIDLSDTKLIKKIWKPDLYFPNAKSGWFQIVTVPNFLLRLYPSGEILYMLRLRLTFSCMMNLNRYPLDHQICPIELASFASTINDLVFIWKDNKAVKLYRDVKLAQFQIVDVYLHNCRESFHIGEYSCLRAELHLKRSIGFYLVQKYFPTMLIVFISWISFWLDVNAIPARVTVGVTTLLTITSESSDSQTKLAPVSYVKALDVWMGVCTTFVFAALIEFTIVNYLARKPFPSRPNVKYSSSSSAGESSTLMTTDDGTMSSSSTSHNDGVVFCKFDHCIYCTLKCKRVQAYCNYMSCCYNRQIRGKSYFELEDNAVIVLHINKSVFTQKKYRYYCNSLHEIGG
ncbi:Glutamate-gated chloride channel [Nymphon striatum]|nr:Glutamate-gated chloride channel [Nymphon striatum]